MLLRNIDGRINCVSCDGIGCLILDKKLILDDEIFMCFFFKLMFVNIVVILKYVLFNVRYFFRVYRKVTSFICCWLLY